MIFTFENGSCNSEQIVYIKASFSEDRKDINGVCRITGIEIECKNDVSHEIKSKVEIQIFNYFADKDYFCEECNWKEEARKDIVSYTGVLNVDVDWE